MINEQKVKIDLMRENQQKIEEYNNNIAALTQEVEALEPEFEKNSTLNNIISDNTRSDSIR